MGDPTKGARTGDNNPLCTVGKPGWPESPLQTLTPCSVLGLSHREEFRMPPAPPFSLQTLQSVQMGVFGGEAWTRFRQQLKRLLITFYKPLIPFSPKVKGEVGSGEFGAPKGQGWGLAGARSEQASQRGPRPPRGARRLRPYGGRAGGNWNKRRLKRAQKPQLGLCPRSHGEPQARRPAPFSSAAGRRRRDLPARIRRGCLAGAGGS